MSNNITATIGTMIENTRANTANVTLGDIAEANHLCRQGRIFAILAAQADVSRRWSDDLQMTIWTRTRTIDEMTVTNHIAHQKGGRWSGTSKYVMELHGEMHGAVVTSTTVVVDPTHDEWVDASVALVRTVKDMLDIPRGERM